MLEKFSVVGGGGGGGGLLDFKVYLSPLLGEGDWSRIERFRERVQEMSREGSERGRVRERKGETREGRRSIATTLIFMLLPFNDSVRR